MALQIWTHSYRLLQKVYVNADFRPLWPRPNLEWRNKMHSRINMLLPTHWGKQELQNTQQATTARSIKEGIFSYGRNNDLCSLDIKQTAQRCEGRYLLWRHQASKHVFCLTKTCHISKWNKGLRQKQLCSTVNRFAGRFSWLNVNIQMKRENAVIRVYNN